MTFRELFANCSFTLSGNVPGQDKQFMKKITNLGFSVRNVDPLVIEKSSSSSGDINSLIEVIQQAFEPLVGDDIEIIETDKCFKVNEKCTESSATTVEDFPTRESTGSHSIHDSSAKDVDLLTREFNTLCIESSEIDAPRQDQTVRKNLQSGNSTRPLDLSSSSFNEEQPDVHMHIPTVSKGSSQQNLNKESDSSTKSLCASGLIEKKETTFVGNKITNDKNETVPENISENDDKCSSNYKIKSKSDEKLTETSTLKSEDDDGKQNKDDKIKCKTDRQPFNAEKTFPTKNGKQSKITMENLVNFGSDKKGSAGKQVSDFESKSNRDEGDKTGSTGKQVSDFESKGNRNEGDKTGSTGKQVSDFESKGNRDEGDKTGSIGKQLSDVENKGNRDGAEIKSKAGIQKKSGDIGNEFGMNRNCADFGEIESNVDGEEEKFYDCKADLQSESDNLSNDGKLSSSQTSEMAVACSDVSSKTQSEMKCNERQGSGLTEIRSRSSQKEEAQRISGKDSKIDFKKADTAVSVEVLKLRDPVKGHSFNDKTEMQQSEENYPGNRVPKLYPDLINLQHNEADPTADCKSSMETGLFSKLDTAKGWPEAQGASGATWHTDLSIVSTGEKRIVRKIKYPGYADKESRPSGTHNETDVALVNLTRGSIGDTTNGEVSFSNLTNFTREYTKTYDRDDRKTGHLEDADMKRRSSRTCTETDVYKFSSYPHITQTSTGKNVSTNREACISQQANLVRDSPEAYSGSDRKTKKSHHVVLPKESVGEYAKPFSSSKAGTKIGRDTGPVHDQARAKPPTRDNNDENNKYTNEFRSSQPMDSSSESEEESNESDSDSQTWRNRIGVEEHLGKVGDEAGHKLQTGRKKDGFEQNIRQRIKFDPQTDLTLLAFILLLPRKTKFPEVKVYVDTEDSIIIVEGRPNEVINIQKMIEETLRGSETSSMQHKWHGKSNNVKPKEQGAYVAESTTEVAPYSIYKKQNVGPPVYKTTHSDSFKDPLRPERREYGSSVDRAKPQSKGFFTERKKIRIQVMKSDITTQQVDAIVNAANGSLKHGGGVARAIADKAGSELQMECARFIKDGNAIPVTGLFVSCGGKLPAKHVIHAVGPRWSRYGEEKKEECARDLRRTVLRCLVEADQRGLRSIAISSISAGEFEQK
ncbi:hypothetical protein RRG08_042088 [Elysia crispata]|uniref:Macro domain-containing protein n=1 Tax=Elysia crispata TaxID=231223 RepID=A0AAE1E956_9GAST|nr:hypothetical protein RRG08_042088 [Elysia crispata]